MESKWVLEKKVNAATAILFFLGMIVLIWFDWLPIWASAMVSLFVSITIRQFIVGRVADIFVSMILFGLLFITNSIYYSEVWTGIVLIVGAAYVFVRQCFEIYNFKSKKHAVNEAIAEEEIHRHERDDPGECERRATAARSFVGFRFQDESGPARG